MIINRYQDLLFFTKMELPPPPPPPLQIKKKEKREEKKRTLPALLIMLQMDSVISHAQATLGALVLQRSTFGGINSKLSNVGSRLPTV